MTEMMKNTAPKRIAAMLLLLALAACTQIESDVGQCEPGVSDISTMATAVPAQC